MRTKPLMPSRSSEPKTNHFCVRCHKDIKNKFYWIHIIDGGISVLHPEDEHLYVADGGDMGLFMIGTDCAKKLGMEWCIKPVTTLTEYAESFKINFPHLKF